MNGSVCSLAWLFMFTSSQDKVLLSAQQVLTESLICDILPAAEGAVRTTLPVGVYTQCGGQTTSV